MCGSRVSRYRSHCGIKAYLRLRPWRQRVLLCGSCFHSLSFRSSLYWIVMRLLRAEMKYLWVFYFFYSFQGFCTLNVFRCVARTLNSCLGTRPKLKSLHVFDSFLSVGCAGVWLQLCLRERYTFTAILQRLAARGRERGYENVCHNDFTS